MNEKKHTYLGQTKSITGWARYFACCRRRLGRALQRGATLEEALKQQKTDRYITINGESRTVADWAKRVGISKFAMFKRIYNGHTGERLLRPSSRWKHGLTAFGRTQTQRQWSKETGIPVGALSQRLIAGLPPEVALTAPVAKRKKRSK